MVPLPRPPPVHRAYLSPVVAQACNELAVTPSVVRMWAADRESWLGDVEPGFLIRRQQRSVSLWTGRAQGPEAVGLIGMVQKSRLSVLAQPW